MKRIKTTMYVALLSFLASVSQCKAQSLSARDVVQKAMDNARGNTFEAEMIIRTIRPTWTRAMTVKTWLKGEKLAMILIKQPVKDNGVAFLKRGKEVWNWIPALERSIKLPPSMMTESWMGTDFTNDDLVKESSMAEDYDHRFAGDTIINGRPCYIIEMIPKPDAAIVWGRLLTCIDKKDYLELNTKFYDEDGLLINTLTAKEIKTMGGRLIPTHVEMIPADKKNQKTEIIYLNVRYDHPIRDDFFSLTQMKNLQ